MNRIPDRLNVEKSDRELYDGIADELFESKTRKEQFFFAMAFGFVSKTKLPLKSKDGFFFVKDMRSEDEVLLNAVAIADTDSVEILSDRGEVFRIAEEYAHAGIRLLHDEVSSGQLGSFYKRFERDMFNIYRDLEARGVDSG